MKTKINKTKYYSYNLNNLPKGCQLCVKGSKMVMFVTGLCPRCCYYCPISDQKYKKDVIYADEWPIKSTKDMINEARLIDAEGAGFTGGDPLCRLDRTIDYIKLLKKQFGKKFHIHLYTSFDLVSKSTMIKLHKAGLDEIRFHPELENSKLWDKIELANQFKWDIGIEIPSIPKKLAQTKKLIDFFHDKIDFINLNELEFADNKFSKLGEMGFKQKDSLSYGVKGSEEQALQLLTYIQKKYPKLNAHYCTAKLKDAVQLANRIKRRAKNVAKPYDMITKEGLLFRGAIYTDQLEKTKNKIIKDYKIKQNLLESDKKRKRILIDPEWLYKNKEKLKKDIKNIRIALVEEYPTYDQLNIVTDFI